MSDSINPYDASGVGGAVAHGTARPSRWPSGLARCAAGYYLLSALSLPLVNRVWLGELPLLALIQLPKMWLKGIIQHGLTYLMRMLGQSSGSFSPDYLATHGLAVVLMALVPMLVVISCLALWPHLANRRRLILMVLVSGLIDGAVTIGFARVSALNLF
ncbi:MAG: hypothetical protein U0795_11800 [Pirellulales bacterium]